MSNCRETEDLPAPGYLRQVFLIASYARTTANFAIINDLPTVAASLGAKASMGFEGSYQIQDMASALDAFVSQLEEGKTFAEATTYTQGALSNFYWGLGGRAKGYDLHGDLYRIRLATATPSDQTAVLRTVVRNGFNSYSYLKDARWGWQP